MQDQKISTIHDITAGLDEGGLHRLAAQIEAMVEQDQGRDRGPARQVKSTARAARRALARIVAEHRRPLRRQSAERLEASVAARIASPIK